MPILPLTIPGPRARHRTVDWALALALLVSVAACARDGGDPVAPAASTSARATDTPAAAVATPAPAPAPAEAVAGPQPAAASGQTPPPRLGGIALADATAAAEPVRGGAADRSTMTPASRPVGVAATGTVDDRCSTAADCAVKDVGSCCGYRPQCVNRDSPTFPEAAKANCASEGRVGICGFPLVESCECVQGHCAALPPSNNGLVQ